jgi:hypothetical protein
MFTRADELLPSFKGTILEIKKMEELIWLLPLCVQRSQIYVHRSIGHLVAATNVSYSLEGILSIQITTAVDPTINK